MCLHNLLSLPCLTTKQTKGEKLLVDYSQSHVVTFIKYLDILRKKTMEKENLEEIKKDEKKGKIND